MAERVLLVDFENVQRFDLGKVPSDTRVMVFAGQSQSKVTTDLLEQALAMSPRFQLVRINGNGRNALDFHIAYYLGKGVCESPNAEFVILSNDKGFDPLVRHLVAYGFKCRRQEHTGAALAPKPPMPAHAQAVVEHLRKIEKNKRPRKLARLINHLSAHFKTKVAPEEIKKAVGHLLEAGLIAATEGAVTYNF